MSEKFDAEVELTTSFGISQTKMRVLADVKAYYDDMKAAGCRLALNAASDFVESNGNKARLSILHGDAIVDFDHCHSLWPEVEALAAEMLRREPWLRLPTAATAKAPAKLVPGGMFKAEFEFHHLNGDVNRSETRYMDECMRPYYQDMLDAGCTLRWTLTDDMQPNGEVSVVARNGDKLTAELVYDTYVDLTNGFIHLLRSEPWLR